MIVRSYVPQFCRRWQSCIQRYDVSLSVSIWFCGSVCHKEWTSLCHGGGDVVDCLLAKFVRFLLLSDGCNFAHSTENSIASWCPMILHFLFAFSSPIVLCQWNSSPSPCHVDLAEMCFHYFVFYMRFVLWMKIKSFILSIWFSQWHSRIGMCFMPLIIAVGYRSRWSHIYEVLWLLSSRSVWPCCITWDHQAVVSGDSAIRGHSY